jgi:hypothetical protein
MNLETRNKWSFGIGMAINFGILLSLLLFLGEMRGAVKEVDALKEFRVKTTETLAIACKNIEYLTKNAEYLKTRLDRLDKAHGLQPPEYDNIKVPEK